MTQDKLTAPEAIARLLAGVPGEVAAEAGESVMGQAGRGEKEQRRKG